MSLITLGSFDLFVVPGSRVSCVYRRPNCTDTPYLVVIPSADDLRRIAHQNVAILAHISHLFCSVEPTLCFFLYISG